MTHTDKAYLRLHLGILLAGATGIFGRLISLSELPLVWMRVLIAAASMALVMALSKSLQRVSATHFLHIGACGIMLAFHWVCFYASIKFANVSIAVVCIALDGFFTALLDSIIHRRTPSPRQTYNLTPNQGIPPHIIMLMAMMAGLTVANLYYNQPLLEMIRSDLHTTSSQANLIAVITQVGYALGLLFIVPTGDLFSRRKIIVVCMVIAALMTAAIGLSDNIFVIWGASLTMGACSIVPQLFIPVAGQFSKPENKARNMGYVLSGLLTGILAARVVSGIIGEWFGWRMMYYIAGIVMVMCLALTLWLMPRMQQNFSGSYLCLMRSVVQIFTRHPRIRLNAIRAAFGFGSMLAFWACLAFHLADEPFRAGSDAVGYLGICGVAGALVASGIGKYIPRYGVKRFSIVGAFVQIAAWLTAWLFGTTYAGLVLIIILIDIGLQCLQLSNQSACIQAVPEASNRANTIFMTTYFIGGSLGTLLAGQGWYVAGWHGVCLVGISFALISLSISIIFDKKY